MPSKASVKRPALSTPVQIANGELTFDLARLRQAIQQPKRKDRPHGKEDVQQELDHLVPGATLVGTRGFGDAIIRHMDDPDS